jgi:hypothetical protein
MTIRNISTLLGGLALLSACLFGQSLGDVARAQRQKQNDKPTASTHKVITDEDIPARADDSQTSDSTSEKSSKVEVPINTEANGEQLKAQCLAAKQQIKEYQGQIDRLRASSQLVEANRYTNGVQYNQHQLRKQQEADRMQKQLDQAKQRFAELQEKARKAGFGSSVYDP